MKATLPEPEIVTKNGKPVSVILPIKHYQELIERLEDAEDVAWLKRLRRRKLDELSKYLEGAACPFAQADHLACEDGGTTAVSSEFETRTGQRPSLQPNEPSDAAYFVRRRAL